MDERNSNLRPFKMKRTSTILMALIFLVKFLEINGTKDLWAELPQPDWETLDKDVQPDKFHGRYAVCRRIKIEDTFGQQLDITGIKVTGNSYCSKVTATNLYLVHNDKHDTDIDTKQFECNTFWEVELRTKSKLFRVGKGGPQSYQLPDGYVVNVPLDTHLVIQYELNATNPSNIDHTKMVVNYKKCVDENAKRLTVLDLKMFRTSQNEAEGNHASVFNRNRIRGIRTELELKHFIAVPQRPENELAVFLNDKQDDHTGLWRFAGPDDLKKGWNHYPVSDANFGKKYDTMVVTCKITGKKHPSKAEEFGCGGLLFVYQKSGKLIPHQEVLLPSRVTTLYKWKAEWV